MNNKTENLFISDSWYLVTKDIFEILYFAAGIVMVLSVILTLVQLISAKRKLINQESRQNKEKSLEILNRFSTIIIPKMDEYNIRDTQENFPKVKDLFNKSFMVNVDKLSKEHLAIVRAKQLNGVLEILNHLEYVSLILNLELADEEIVYESISTVYCTFIRDEYLNLAVSRANDIPFSNVIKLFGKWDKKMRINKITKAQNDLEKLKSEL